MLADGQRKLLKRHWVAIRGNWAISKEERDIVRQVLSTPEHEKKMVS